MHLFSWGLVLMMSLSLKVDITCTLLHFPLICLLDISSKTCCSDVGSFMQILRIQTFFLFLSRSTWFHGLLFSDWEIYDMLWCSHYYVVIQMVVPLGGKLTLTSNVLSLIKGLSGRSILMLGGWKYLCQA